MATPWLRLYTGILNDPKVQRLAPEVFRGWVNLLCLAKENDGTLPDVPTIAFTLRMSEQEVNQLLETLTENSLLDKAETGLSPHNWNGRQYISDVSTVRVQRHRKRKRNVSVTVPERTDTDRKKESSESEFNETFWPAYPRKEAKGSALKAFIKARSKTSLEAIMDGVRRYVRDCSGREKQYIAMPATWLNADRWLDEPSTAPPFLSGPKRTWAEIKAERDRHQG